MVDAFTDRPFAGNQAAVCLVDSTVSETWMQRVAAEMNYSETAFVVPGQSDFSLRWFTPACEVDLCGHATLATAHILWSSGIVTGRAPVRFTTRSGILTARQTEKELIELDFPATPAKPTDVPGDLLQALGVSDVRYVGRNAFDILVAIDSAQTLRELTPNLQQLRTLDVRGVIVTCPSDVEQYDFLSRFFAPRAGVDEDPVTGSAHCCLAPYWAELLDQVTMTGYQASSRGGVVQVTLHQDRVLLGGRAVTMLQGELTQAALKS